MVTDGEAATAVKVVDAGMQQDRRKKNCRFQQQEWKAQESVWEHSLKAVVKWYAGVPTQDACGHDAHQIFQFLPCIKYDLI